jgi:hypothetical protein
MTEPNTEHLTTPRMSSAAAPPIDETFEPLGALMVGGAAGALTFLLCALLFGARWAIAIAIVAAVASLVKRMRAPAIVFAAAGAFAAMALAPSTLALLVASVTFGIGLALAARAVARAVARDAMLAR